MAINELIEVAKICSFGECDERCPFYTAIGCHPEDVIACSGKLIELLTSKLELVINDINKNCKTCLHKEKGIRELPCTTCVCYGGFPKWQWRGGSND